MGCTAVYHTTAPSQGIEVSFIDTSSTHKVRLCCCHPIHACYVQVASSMRAAGQARDSQLLLCVRRWASQVVIKQLATH